jgi:uncharacterized protein YdeI (YjbR/CyaY-like superfamily)
MAKKDPRIDAYIEKAEPFARPILKHLRKVVHKGSPDVVETMKWSFPHFDAHGGGMASMAAFKQHCAFGLWKGSLIGVTGAKNGTAPGMGSFGRITSLADLPSEKKLVDWVNKAAELNRKGVKVARKKPMKNRPLSVPSYFTRALSKNKRALSAFRTMSRSHQREYVDWVVDAKSEETRSRRLETAVKWLSEGKSRNWKYERK